MSLAACTHASLPAGQGNLGRTTTEHSPHGVASPDALAHTGCRTAMTAAYKTGKTKSFTWPSGVAVLGTLPAANSQKTAGPCPDVKGLDYLV